MNRDEIADAHTSTHRPLRRRRLLRGIATGAAAVAIAPWLRGAAHSGRHAKPAWRSVPTIRFTQGVPARVSLAAFVVGAPAASLEIIKNSASLPRGVTYDAATQSLVYDGIGQAASTTGHRLAAVTRDL